MLDLVKNWVLILLLLLFSESCRKQDTVLEQAKTDNNISPTESYGKQDAQCEKNNIKNRLLPVRIGYKFGYINTSGKIIIEPIYDSASILIENHGLVKLKGKWGFIDTLGQIVINPQFQTAFDFSEGLAQVKVEGKWGYIDKKGDLVIPAKYKLCGKFSNAVAPTLIDWLWGYIDKDGNLVIQPQYGMASPFVGEFARVRVNLKNAFIRKDGCIAYGPTDNEIEDFSENVAAVKFGDKWGYIDTGFETIIEPKYLLAGPFSEGLAKVALSRTEWGYINQKGKLLIKTSSFSCMEDFHNGLAAIETNGKYGFIDKKGDLVISAKFDYVDHFNNGLAYVVEGNRKGYINKNSKWVWFHDE